MSPTTGRHTHAAVEPWLGPTSAGWSRANRLTSRGTKPKSSTSCARRAQVNTRKSPPPYATLPQPVFSAPARCPCHTLPPPTPCERVLAPPQGSCRTHAGGPVSVALPGVWSPTSVRIRTRTLRPHGKPKPKSRMRGRTAATGGGGLPVANTDAAEAPA